MGKVYLIGAGPGDLELITLKALHAIKKANMILYDRLVNPELLDFASPSCESIYVGKEDRRHSLPQDEINALLVKCAREKEIVVRLKGGDPFVFGRGGEEALHLKENGIPFEIIPGVTSSIAAPAYAGIPVTHRGLASSFAVIAGHECPKKAFSSLNWPAFQGIDTLVFLMGVSNREEIAQKLIEIGRKADEPVAFVMNGTTPSQKVLITSLQELAKGQGGEVESPAVMVVGKVVTLHEELSWFIPTESMGNGDLLEEKKFFKNL